MVVNLGPRGGVLPNLPRNPRADGLGYNPRCLRRDVNKNSVAGARANYTYSLIMDHPDVDSFYNRYLGQPFLRGDPYPWGVSHLVVNIRICGVVEVEKVDMKSIVAQRRTLPHRRRSRRCKFFPFPLSFSPTNRYSSRTSTAPLAIPSSTSTTACSTGSGGSGRCRTRRTVSMPSRESPTPGVRVTVVDTFMGRDRAAAAAACGRMSLI